MWDTIKTLTKLCVACLVLAGGYILFTNLGGAGDAVIDEMTPSGLLGNAQCRLGFDFKRIPQGAGPMDIKVVFTGDILERGTVEYYWNFIGANAQVPRKKYAGWEAAPGIYPSMQPPLNTKFSVNFPVPVKNTASTKTDFDVTATLYWGGKEQDSSTRSFRQQHH